LQRLAGDTRHASAFDDRRFTIEVQSSDHVDLTATRPLAVILPSIYLDEDRIRGAIETRWKAEAITYPIASLSIENYYASIYERVADFYKGRGLL
jgi:hypothetical protein